MSTAAVPAVVAVRTTFALHVLRCPFCSAGHAHGIAPTGTLSRAAECGGGVYQLHVTTNQHAIPKRRKARGRRGRA